LGRRIVSERRRQVIEVPFERRAGAERRTSARRSSNERRVSPPEGVHRLDE
jgi:hypothetical protein